MKGATLAAVEEGALHVVVMGTATQPKVEIRFCVCINMCVYSGEA